MKLYQKTIFYAKRWKSNFCINFLEINMFFFFFIRKRKFFKEDEKILLEKFF